jgi:aminoglycoside phosphotransferase (APT) family kinase protein
VHPDQITAMHRRAFGTDTTIVSVTELGLGSYNNTYRVHATDGRTTILRVAPEPTRQYRIERAMMRNEHAALPHFAPVAAMMPRTLFADWTHDIIGRDHIWQTVLDGVSAPDGLRTYPRSEWAPFYRQLGTITRTVHHVRGDRFGPVAGPTFTTWSDAVIAYLADTAADLADAGLDATDVHAVTALAERHRAVLDEIDQPRLLHGDLWTVNVMLAPSAPEPTITGLLDHDRSSWGDPAADWTTYLAAKRPGTERDAFWETYGRPADDPASRWRALVYRARHIGAVRLERHRLGTRDTVSATYGEMREVLELLTS